MSPLRRMTDPKRVKNNVSSPTKEKVPITGRWIQGSCIVGSFNDSDGNNPENIRTSKIKITDPKNNKLPARLITIYHELIEFIKFCNK